MPTTIESPTGSATTSGATLYLWGTSSAESAAERSRFATPNGTCTIGKSPAGDCKWLRWSSKNTCGFSIDSTLGFSIPPRKKHSSGDTPQSFNVVTTRSCEGALRAVTMAIRKMRLYAGSSANLRSSSMRISESLRYRSASGPGECGMPLRTRSCS
ncbi:hypothetical protein D3C78_1145270 [compost metagenome]